MTSDAYRQSSRARPEAVAVDPENRLLGWFPRQRLPAESIRDQALFVSGLLNPTTGPCRWGGKSCVPALRDRSRACSC
ncbi:MAG: DUF1553 domain-containing protein [Planctomycetota bacterium]